MQFSVCEATFVWKAREKAAFGSPLLPQIKDVRGGIFSLERAVPSEAALYKTVDKNRVEVR